MNRPSLSLALAISLLTTGCSFAPVYHVPEAPILPSNFRELGDWKAAQPADQIQRDLWWQLYKDKTLDELESHLDSASPDIAAALAHYDAARAINDQVDALQYPLVTAVAGSTRNRQSDNRPLRGRNQPDTYSANTLGAGISYELDVWGRVRNQVELGRDLLQANAADLESARLSLHAQLADNYFELRSFDLEQQLLSETLVAYQRALELTKSRHDGGIASGLDVARAQGQFEHARTTLTDLFAKRTLSEHIIATLIGEPATTFHIVPSLFAAAIPDIPVGAPSSLLERRPDIAAAERRMAAANESIGIAKTAYFPSLSLSALAGFQSTQGAGWLTAPNTFWAIGPSALFTVFDGGLRKAQIAEAEAKLRERSANYRGSVLLALQQVEDNLVLLNTLTQEAESENAAVKAGKQAHDIALSRYREGTANYLAVIDAQTAYVQAQRVAVDIKRRQLRSSINLIRSLGGGWTSPQLVTLSK